MGGDVIDKRSWLQRKVGGNTWSVNAEIAKRLQLRNKDKIKIEIRTESGRHVLSDVFTLTSGCEIYLSQAKREQINSSPAPYRVSVGGVIKPPDLGRLERLYSSRADKETAKDMQDILTDSGLSRTEQKALVNARIGQGKFRQQLIAEWKHCPISGVQNPALLRASHIKPWRESTNKERLDHHNGLLLSRNLDGAFDEGLISFNEKGGILFSNRLSKSDRSLLGLSENMFIDLSYARRKFMKYHRKRCFKH